MQIGNILENGANIAGIFTGTENGGFTGFFIEFVKKGEEIGALFGRIFFRYHAKGTCILLAEVYSQGLFSGQPIGSRIRKLDHHD